MQCLASVLFPPAPQGGWGAEPGVGEYKERVVSMLGYLRALDVISIVAEPTITKGEEYPGWYELSGLLR